MNLLNLNDQQKVDVIVTVMKERFSQVEQIRKRGIQLMIWFIGLCLLVLGYSVKKDLILSLPQLLTIITTLIILSGFLIWYLNDMEKGHSIQLDILQRTEETLHLYEPGYFSVTENESILPSFWLKKKRNKKRRIFRFIKILVILFDLFIVTILLLPILVSQL